MFARSVAKAALGDTRRPFPLAEANKRPLLSEMPLRVG